MQVALFNQVQNVFNHSACAICRDPFEINQRVAKLACDHLFHENCLHFTIEHCPLCNRRIDRAERKEIQDKVMAFASRFFPILSVPRQRLVANEINKMPIVQLQNLYQLNIGSSVTEEQFELLVDLILDHLIKHLPPFCLHGGLLYLEQLTDAIYQAQEKVNDPHINRILTGLRIRIPERLDFRFAIQARQQQFIFAARIYLQNLCDSGKALYLGNLHPNARALLYKPSQREVIIKIVCYATLLTLVVYLSKVFISSKHESLKVAP